MRLVKATVHLVGLSPSDPPAWADENDAQIARWLRGGQLLDVTPNGAGDAPPTPGAFLDGPPARPSVSRETSKPRPARKTPVVDA